MTEQIAFPTLAQRREALIAECSMQRSDVSHQIAALRSPAQGGLGRLDGLTNLKVPLMIAGVVLGMVVVKPSRAMPLLATGLSLFKLAKSILSIARSQGYPR
ncbi:MAG TPA: hypothetical protein VGC21_00645 [Telluria sp.]